ncbi:MAG: MarR family transcriptional regulator [Chloroflexi bacterium]|nr:MarR family transcriptional regulator [Chloroflexota bacterium]
MSSENLYPIAVEIQTYAALLLKFFNAALEERLRTHGEKISGLQHGVLRMLLFESLTISEISQRLGLTPSTLVRSVDSLERKGLTQRGSDPHDRRRHPVSITNKGRALMTAVPVIGITDPTLLALEKHGIESAAQLRDLLRELIKEFPEGKLVSGLMSGQMGKE